MNANPPPAPNAVIPEITPAESVAAKSEDLSRRDLLTKLLQFGAVAGVGAAATGGGAALLKALDRKVELPVLAADGRLLDESLVVQPEQPPAPVTTVPMKVTASALLLLLLAPAFLNAGVSAPGFSPAAAPAATPVITLEARKEGSENLIIATVTADGKPVAGATLEFFAARSFGRLGLGHDTTLADGTAAVPFPEGLPGGKEGKLSVRAEVTVPETLAGASGEALIAAQTATADGTAPIRELWSRRPPRLLLATVLALVALVWGIYAWVFLNLLKLRQEAPR